MAKPKPQKEGWAHINGNKKTKRHYFVGLASKCGDWFWSSWPKGLEPSLVADEKKDCKKCTKIMGADRGIQR